ncbi:hypothetical protein [Halovenus salina]|uniref:Zinc ribbon domain-containing protein n=1 Tax=Halovenus salina TaxID=1510225 RepID=A0ABD5W1G5_9EURY|nr:hypothetical protein [Halovenus salina]
MKQTGEVGAVIAGTVTILAFASMVNATVGVALGAIVVVGMATQAGARADTLVLGGLSLALSGVFATVFDTFPAGEGVVAAAGFVGVAIGLFFQWANRVLARSSGVVRLIWRLIHLQSTVITIVKVAVVLPLTFAAGVAGEDIDVFGGLTFVLFSLSILAGFYAVDQGRGLLSLKTDVRDSKSEVTATVNTARSQSLGAGIAAGIRAGSERPVRPDESAERSETVSHSEPDYETTPTARRDEPRRTDRPDEQFGDRSGTDSDQPREAERQPPANGRDPDSTQSAPRGRPADGDGPRRQTEPTSNSHEFGGNSQQSTPQSRWCPDCGTEITDGERRYCHQCAAFLGQ